MFIFPDMLYRNYYMRETGQVSHIRMLNSSVNSRPVDVYLNERLFFRNLEYMSFSEYKPIPSGIYNVTVFPAGTTANPIFSRSIFIPPGKIWTAAITGNYPNIGILPIEDVIMPKPQDKVMLKFVNLFDSPVNLNLVTHDGRTLFRNVPYMGVTSYETLDPGTYTFFITDQNNRRLLTVPNARLLPNRFYSIAAVGNSLDPTNMKLLIPLDGNSYIRK